MAEIVFYTLYGVLIPCRCGHRNRVAKKVQDTIKMILLDGLPACKKCGKQLHGKDYDLKGLPYVQRIRKELGLLEDSK